MRLNTTDLIRILTHRHGHLQDFYRIALRDIIAVISRQLAVGNTVHLIGLGTFSPRMRAARAAWDFRLQRRIRIPARRHVSFHPSDALRSAVGGNQRDVTDTPMGDATQSAVKASRGSSRSEET